MAQQDFVNLTPYPTEILSEQGEHLTTVEPSGSVAFAAGNPPELLNVPEPSEKTVYIVLPAVTHASDRTDLISIELEEAHRTSRGNIRSHVCHWSAV